MHRIRMTIEQDTHVILMNINICVYCLLLNVAFHCSILPEEMRLVSQGKATSSFFFASTQQKKQSTECKGNLQIEKYTYI